MRCAVKYIQMAFFKANKDRRMTVKVITYYEKHSYIFYTPFLTVFNHKSHIVDLLVAEGHIISRETEILKRLWTCKILAICHCLFIRACEKMYNFIRSPQRIIHALILVFTTS